MSNVVEGLLEVYKDMAVHAGAGDISQKGLPQVEDFPCGAPSCSEACLFFNIDFFRLRLQLLNE